MAKRKYCGIPTPVVVPPQTNLSISLTWADDFAEGNNSVYTISWTLTWVIGSPNTVLTATLPAGITFVSASDGGTEDAGVITWTLWDIMANGSRTFIVTSSTQDTYELLAHIEWDYANLGTADASKEVEVTEAWSWVEVRLDWTVLWWNNMLWPDNIISLTWSVYWDLLLNFTQDIAWISGSLRRIWYINNEVVAQDILTCSWVFGVFVGYVIYSPYTYDWNAPLTIPVYEHF